VGRDRFVRVATPPLGYTSNRHVERYAPVCGSALNVMRWASRSWSDPRILTSRAGDRDPDIAFHLAVFWSVARYSRDHNEAVAYA